MMRDIEEDVDIVVLADEIGMSFARAGDDRFRSWQRLIFALGDGDRFGRIIVSQGDDPAAHQALRAPALTLVNIRNLPHCEPIEGRLVFSASPLPPGGLEGLFAEIDLLAEEGFVADGRVICNIDVSNEMSASELRAAESGLRGRGIEPGLSGFHGDDASLAALDLLQPRLLVLDRSWFFRVADNLAARELLAAMIATVHAAGADTLVGDIGDRDELRVAVRSGVRLAEGPGLAGALRLGEPDPRSNAPVLSSGGRDKVIPIAASTGFHQRR